MVQKGEAIRIDDKVLYVQYLLNCDPFIYVHAQLIYTQPITQSYDKHFTSQRNAYIGIYSSRKTDPKTVSKQDAKELGNFTIKLPNVINGKVVVEFVFSTNLLTVYAYPEGNPKKRKKCRVEYL